MDLLEILKRETIIGSDDYETMLLKIAVMSTYGYNISRKIDDLFENSIHYGKMRQQLDQLKKEIEDEIRG